MEKIQNFLEILKKKLNENDKIIAEYEGIFNQEIVKKYASIINKTAKNYPKLQRQLFYVFVELAQNVGFYSDIRQNNYNKNTGIGSLLIYENINEIGFLIGNPINTKAYEVLERKCKIINSMDRESLRELKRYQRNLIPGTNGGAHIGLIMVALTTKNKLEIDKTKINNNLNFFYLKVKISKDNK
jgi:hypothetical protein